MNSVAERHAAETGKSEVYKLSWTAYVASTIVSGSLTVGALALLPWLGGVALGMAATVLAAFTLKVLTLKSIELYTDAGGVWIFRGVFPWSRGVYGVRWRDLDDAVMFTGLFPWLTHSYRVRVGHRYTRSSEIDISHVGRGDQFVVHVNQRCEVERQLDAAVAIHDAVQGRV